MTSKYGVFKETQGLCQGDPYIDTVKPDPRDKGLNFKSPTCRVGKNNDATFDKFKPLYEGEKFVEPLRSAIQQKNASKKHNVTEKPWKAASPMKESACPGDFVGTLGGKVPYVAGTVEIKRKKGEVQGTPKNIVTGPSKKGGFGFNKTTLSERQGALGVAGEYQYLADPIHQATRKPADAAAVKPFRPANPPPTGGPGTVTRNLLGRAAGAVGEFEWRPRPEAAAAGSSSGADGAAAAEAAAAPVPFKPVSVPRKGPMATFNQFPEYLHDPETAKFEARKQQRAKEKELLAAHAGGAWRPGGQVKSDATKSIIRMNL
ncbi:hypothetical protein OEZ86_001732 [Tetradesmus obliquus]|nr:hypothetical protein OEZ86_001732 [Tetradesmus obliquus]